VPLHVLYSFCCNYSDAVADEEKLEYEREGKRAPLPPPRPAEAKIKPKKKSQRRPLIYQTRAAAEDNQFVVSVFQRQLYVMWGKNNLW